MLAGGRTLVLFFILKGWTRLDEAIRPSGVPLNPNNLRRGAAPRQTPILRCCVSFMFFYFNFLGRINSD
jgi:hypothetical protein